MVTNSMRYLQRCEKYRDDVSSRQTQTAVPGFMCVHHVSTTTMTMMTTTMPMTMPSRDGNDNDNDNER
eukprot:1782276-Rhodomonas_salina.2